MGSSSPRKAASTWSPRACAALRDTPGLTKDYAKRVYCTARNEDWTTAALTYDTANALGVLSTPEAGLLAQYLDPELIEVAPTLAPTSKMSSLVFRLYEAVGSPLPTRGLPIEFAIADLRGTAGWKAEIEAAERLARTGAMPANRLLGLYTDRSPAASGGVWDRVAAVQAFDAAVTAGDLVEVAQTLPVAWEYMEDHGLQAAFATLFGETLARMNLPTARGLSFEISLLSPVYESAAATFEPQSTRQKFLVGLARGEPDPSLAVTPIEVSIAQAFAASGPSQRYVAPLSEGRLGQVILSAVSRLNGAESRQNDDLVSALATLRAVGLEGVARRAALEILLLKRPE